MKNLLLILTLAITIMGCSKDEIKEDEIKEDDSCECIELLDAYYINTNQPVLLNNFVDRYIDDECSNGEGETIIEQNNLLPDGTVNFPELLGYGQYRTVLKINCF